MPTIAVTGDHFHYPQQEYFCLLTKAGYEVRFVDPVKHDLTKPDVLLAQLEGCDAVMCSTEPYPADLLNQCSVRVLSRLGVGFDSIDLQAATANNIVVCRTPGVLHESAAEQTLAFLFAISRNVIERDRQVRAGLWKRICWPRLAGQTLGLLGLGLIGRSVAMKALALGMKVIAYDPVAAPHEGIELVTLDRLWSQADIVSLHAPCTPETANIINHVTLQRMKRGVILINTSRGGLVDEGALAEALQSGQVLAAGLDVFHDEPPRADNPLLKLDNVVLAPHMAGMDLESERAMATMSAENIMALHRGEWPTAHIVNPDVQPTWKW
ncbi:3-phosphoglycerate dehydrogenase [Blastopirellula marina]|uniref:3-phosphoglycerate dehydrogenase n=1 Tax=Blastopirellula marina TaxID=124 RepID=A0A2S8F016_9BACT|nr:MULTISPECIES: phosphoglycerate dehydrogenase [Pirellulaceae]PQO25506.1 3-phosphoglycerate dehydrogenase [Blastopirellula marina]RCS42470.1 3-phosphoglycerate dehydrogenase [Bremerella cremea]